MYLKNFFKHLKTITRHRHMVMKYCFKCGMYKQGLLHDLSKYSPTELFTSVKYYVGTSSPINFERKENKVSKVWLHHKGRNMHHPEYWIDKSLESGLYEPTVIPFKYIAESVLDRIAAAKNYNKENFIRYDVEHYYLKEEKTIPMCNIVKNIFRILLNFYVLYGEDELFKLIKLLNKLSYDTEKVFQLLKTHKASEEVELIKSKKDK